MRATIKRWLFWLFADNITAEVHHRMREIEEARKRAIELAINPPVIVEEDGRAWPYGVPAYLRTEIKMLEADIAAATKKHRPRRDLRRRLSLAQARMIVAQERTV